LELREVKILEDDINMHIPGTKEKQPNQEEIINIGTMDAATCDAAMGVLNENRQCLLDAERNPDEPDILILRKPRYRKPGEGITPQQ
jgi:ferritin-like metal-binding protein YciE